MAKFFDFKKSNTASITIDVDKIAYICSAENKSRIMKSDIYFADKTSQMIIETMDDIMSVTDNKFVKLTQLDGSSILINNDYLMTMVQQQDKSLIYLGNYYRRYVRETVEEIKALISSKK